MFTNFSITPTNLFFFLKLRMFDRQASIFYPCLNSVKEIILDQQKLLFHSYIFFLLVSPKQYCYLPYLTIYPHLFIYSHSNIHSVSCLVKKNKNYTQKKYLNKKNESNPINGNMMHLVNQNLWVHCKD